MTNNRLLSLLLLGSMLLGTNGLQAQEVQSFSLDEAVKYALAQSNAIKAAEFDVYIAQKSVNQILAMGYPQLSGSATTTYNLNIAQFVFVPEGAPPQRITAGYPFNMTMGATLNQLVFDGTFFVGLAASKTFVNVSRIQENRTREQVVYDVSRAYYSALITRERLAVLDANVRRLDDLYRETSALNESGFVEKIDVERLDINRTNLRIERDKLIRFVEMSKDLLKFQMNLDVNSVIELTEKLDDLTSPETAEIEAADYSIENRLDYQLVQTQIKLEGYNWKRYKVGYLPSLYAYGQYQRQNLWSPKDDLKFPGINFPVSSVGLQLNVPIFDGLLKYNQMQQSKLTSQKLQLQLNTLENAVALELRNTRGNVENAFYTLQSLEDNAKLAERVFLVAQTKYKEGVGSSLEVNNAESQLKESQANLLNGKLELLLAKIDLEKALGNLSPQRFE